MNSDFKDMLRCLNDVGAKYLVVGAYAVMHYTEPRYTKDLDIAVGANPQNARKVFQALEAFGAPLTDVTERDFSEPDVFFQIGVEPVRIDIITTLGGIEFDNAWARRESHQVEGIEIHLISREDLIRAKEASGRRQDKADAKALRAPVRNLRQKDQHSSG